MKTHTHCTDTFQLIHFSWFDPVVIILLLTGIIVSIPFLQSHTAKLVEIYRDNTIIAKYPLDTDRIFEIQGADGPMKIQIKKQSVSVLESSCHHQICIQSGLIRNTYNQIVCIPNHILITLSGDSNRGVDAVAK